jgi:hypothetical protein
MIRLIELSTPGLDAMDHQWDDEYSSGWSSTSGPLRDPEMAKDREASTAAGTASSRRSS